jgi:hypothetical protein
MDRGEDGQYHEHIANECGRIGHGAGGGISGWNNPPQEQVDSEQNSTVEQQPMDVRQPGPLDQADGEQHH